MHSSLISELEKEFSGEGLKLHNIFTTNSSFKRRVIRTYGCVVGVGVILTSLFENFEINKERRLSRTISSKLKKYCLEALQEALKEINAECQKVGANGLLNTRLKFDLETRSNGLVIVVFLIGTAVTLASNNKKNGDSKEIVINA